MDMTKTALVLRNVSQIAFDEIESLVTLLTSNTALEEISGESASLSLLKDAIDERDFKMVQKLLSNAVVRDYFYNQIKLATDHHVILHLDEHPENQEREYILNKITQIEQNTQINLLYIGGGHGGPVGFLQERFLSGLSDEMVTNIVSILTSQSMTIDGIILHSCSSARFANLFRPLLTPNGAMLSYCAEISSSENWNAVIDSIHNANQDDFFSEDAKTKVCISNIENLMTTCVISTKSNNRLMDLSESTTDLPGYIDKSEESTIQRDLLLSFLRNPNESNSATTTIETDGNEFNDVTVMEQFNQSLLCAMQDRATKDSLNEESKPFQPR